MRDCKEQLPRSLISDVFREYCSKTRWSVSKMKSSHVGVVGLTWNSSMWEVKKNHEFETNLGFTAGSCFKANNEMKWLGSDFPKVAKPKRLQRNASHAQVSDTDYILIEASVNILILIARGVATKLSKEETTQLEFPHEFYAGRRKSLKLGTSRRRNLCPGRYSSECDDLWGHLEGSSDRRAHTLTLWPGLLG